MTADMLRQGHQNPLPDGGPRVAIVGGGLAGLAAAEAAARCGLRVELFEARRRLGGRAGSFHDRGSGLWIDHCQHVGLDCCTNLIEFCRRTGVDDCFRHDGRLHIIGPQGTRHDFAATAWLPAPLHLAPALLRLGFLSLRDRFSIARAIVSLVCPPRDEPEPAGQIIDAWLRRHGQSEQAVRLFWLPVLISALSQSLDRIDLSAARKVFLDGFLAAPRAYRLYLPTVPLSEIYDRRLARHLGLQGVAVHLGTGVRRIEGDRQRATELVLADGTRQAFDDVIVAVPWFRAGRLLAPALQEALPQVQEAARIPPAPITAVHLWFDQPLTRLPHAVLVGRTGQWVFCRGDDCYYQVVISASDGRARRERVVAQVCDELRAIWPAARQARLRRARTLTHPAAVFSAEPGMERLRPAQQTGVANLFLAGDWTATGWPATMEGAVRSGCLAVESLLRSIGRGTRLLVPDLPRSRLVRWWLR
jgi:squalene-associated FAD-dependent desaturase